MDLYGIQEARSQGNSLTRENELYNEQVRSTRDRINNTFDSAAVTDKAQTAKDKSSKTTDSLIYSAHDTLSGVNFGQSVGTLNNVSKEQARLKGLGQSSSYYDAARSYAKQANPRANLQFGSATATNDKVASSAVANTTSARAPASVAPTVGDDPSEFTAANYRAAKARVTGNTPAAGEANVSDPSAPSKKSSTSLEGGLGEDEDESLGQIAKKGASTAGGALKLGGALAGGVSAFELAKNGLEKNADGKADVAGDIGQIASAATTGLDILGLFFPPAEALGAIAGVVSSVAGSIDTYNKDKQVVVSDQGTETGLAGKKASELSKLGSLRSTAPVNELQSSGLVASQSQHVQHLVNPSGSF
tara:strand:- start:107 stop:1189 length:1083 start_codon:yes stop_codon:yes gene_type:complete